MMGHLMQFRRFVYLVIGVLAVGGIGAAAPEIQTVAKPDNLQLLAPLEVERLDNGMVFLLYPTRRAPIFSGVIRFDIGGKDELPGMTGIAHMFEHMAFKGTTRIGTRNWEAEREALKKVEEAADAFDRAREEILRTETDPVLRAQKIAAARTPLEAAQQEAGQYVVKNEYDEIYSREGSTDMNATTSSDATTYFLSLPANRLELWAKLEAERLIDPVLREFYAERDVVMEERRMRNDNSPIGRLWELMMNTAFAANSYRYPVIGWEADIRNLSMKQARAFFDAHYTPDRAVGVIVGDIDIEATRKLLRETFGKWQRDEQAAAPRTIIPEPPQLGERRAELRIDAQPTILMGWHKPAIPSVDDVRAEVLAEVLTGGRSTRWFEKFVKRDRLAADVSCFTGPGDAQDNLFMIYANPAADKTLAELENALRAEVASLRATPVDAQEVVSARKRLLANTTRALESNLGLAQRLAETAQISGDPWYLERRLRQIEQVTPQDLQEFASKYLLDENLTVGLIKPSAATNTEAASNDNETSTSTTTN